MASCMTSQCAGWQGCMFRTWAQGYICAILYHVRREHLGSKAYRRHELHNITPLLQSPSQSCLYDSVLSNISHDWQPSRRSTVAHKPVPSKVPDLATCNTSSSVMDAL